MKLLSGVRIHAFWPAIATNLYTNLTASCYAIGNNVAANSDAEIGQISNLGHVANVWKEGC
jgi:hypothetical protein